MARARAPDVHLNLNVRGMRNVQTGDPLESTSGQPYELDLTGLGARFAISIGLSQ